MLFKNVRLLLGFLLWEGIASSLLPRGGDDSGGHEWIDHDKVVAFSQNASPGLEGQLELRFNPNLFVDGGCDPYPAVDANGNLGAGLKPTNGGRSGCDGGGTGQVYARRGDSQGRTAIMYSYYFPKVRWAGGDSGGHRHYWASIVVWIHRWGCKVEDATATWPVGISFTSDHLQWSTANAGEISFTSSTVGVDMPTHPRMQIHDNAITPFVNGNANQVFERTLVGWQSLPNKAQQALNDVKYEKTETPVADDNFQTLLDAAYRESFYGGLLEEADCDAGYDGNDTRPLV
ncbi:npp1 domain protein [Colletotrichum truncatum]|uniref:Npp1 domain protein n=1 Tax=Colletotrichum truncatum TaxID=5467 RepID=A0ACC3Z247_COLTU|nr:npp1 domain protein [Colletotrichum truncatum]KAF6781686.1 npp1 domain protein [Colletotrichum truncatum]